MLWTVAPNLQTGVSVVLDLRYARVWLVMGWLLVVGVTIASLVPVHSLPPVDVSDKFEHTLAYAALTLWFAGIYPRSRYLRVVMGLFVLGVAIEFAQGAMNLGRQRDYHDVIANSSGIALGVVVAFMGLDRWARWLEDWARK